MSFDKEWTEWHVPLDQLNRYAKGAAETTTRESVEAHLLTCEHCRAELGTTNARDSARPDAVLRSIIDRIDRPSRPLRHSSGVLQASVASPQLVMATLGLAMSLLVGVLLASAIEPQIGALLLVAAAPLTPVAAAAIAFWPTTDPAGSLSSATPLASGRLPFLRAMVAIAISALAGVGAAAFTPLPFSSSLAWLAPGFALAAVVIATATWINPVRLAIGLGVGWCLLSFSWMRGHRTLDTVDALGDLATGGTPSQLLCVGVIVVASMVTFVRRNSLPDWRTA